MNEWYFGNKSTLVGCGGRQNKKKFYYNKKTCRTKFLSTSSYIQGAGYGTPNPFLLNNIRFNQTTNYTIYKEPLKMAAKSALCVHHKQLPFIINKISTEMFKRNCGDVKIIVPWYQWWNTLSKVQYICSICFHTEIFGFWTIINSI